MNKTRYRGGERVREWLGSQSELRALSILYRSLFSPGALRTGRSCLFLLAFFATQAVALSVVQSVSYSEDEKSASVVITSDELFSYRTFALDANRSARRPPRYVIDLNDTTSRVALGRRINSHFFHGVRTGTHRRQGKNFVRMVFDLKQYPVTVHQATEHRGGDFQITLVFRKQAAEKTKKSVGTEKATKAATLADDKLLTTRELESLAPAKKRSRTVVMIDPGHGGRDPGASSNDVIEKKVVLSIALQLYKMLQRDPLFRAEMTRYSDSRMPLAKRVRIAQRAKADIFISIHADALPDNPRIRGASVYTLSEKASDRLAQKLADMENSVGGLAPGLDNLPADLRLALSDIQLQATRGNSEKLAAILLARLKRIGPIAFDRPHSANFSVLRSPIASVLVETGFLTNHQDARRLASKKEHKRIAKALFDGLREYRNRHLILRPASKSPPRSAQARTHTVKKNDTLYAISRRYRVSVARLRSFNAVRSNNIYVGQKLRIPD